MKRFLIILLAATLTACGGQTDSAGDMAEETTEETMGEETAAAEEQPMEETQPDIVALASETEALSTLVAAVKAADLVSTLQGEGPFTVFAPTNEAFDALPEGTLESLLQPENKEQLTSILTYHVVQGEVKSTDLSDGMNAATVNGAQITVSIAGDGTVMINDATVVQPDVEASNGVVHVIDQVIMPPQAQ